MSGTAGKLDPRLHAVRPDLADARLRGRVEAERFVEGTLARVLAPHADLRRRPGFDAPIDTQALMGEVVRIFEDDGEGFAYVQLEGDGYVGYLPSEALARDLPEPAFRVPVLRTFVYPGPSLKLPPSGYLGLGARVAVLDEKGDYAAIAGGGYVHRRHLVPLHETAPDFVAVAESLMGVPYLWGGKTSLGLDCSGLVQLALDAAGLPAPRDSDMQEASLGEKLPVDDALGHLRRGDLVFWRGHVGIMRDPVTLLHANGHHMLTASEPIAQARARIAANSYGAITAIRRLPALGKEPESAALTG